MRFGVFFQAPESPGQTHADRYAEMLELVELADSLGFDVAWLAEIHFGGAFSLLSDPLMVVPAIAQRTRRIRIGTAVTLLPLHHPLHCAEQAAIADVLSGGLQESPDHLLLAARILRRPPAAAQDDRGDRGQSALRQVLPRAGRLRRCGRGHRPAPGGARRVRALGDHLLVRPGLATAARGGRADDAAVRRSGHAEAATA